MRSARMELMIMALVLSIAPSPEVVSAEYPTRQIQLIVPFPPGGVADLWARKFGQELATAWGQPVVVENRPGAGTTIAAAIVAKSPADGYTIYITNIGHPMSAGLYRNLSYDVEADFSPITIVANVTSILAATPSLPANSTKELIALARAKPGNVNYASAGNGTASHLFAEYLKLLAGINLTHVPYKGTAPALGDLMSNRVQLIIEPMPTMLPHIKAGKLKALGVTTAKRAPAAPEIPSLAESGVPGFDISIWYGFLAPRAIPKSELSKLHSELARIARSPEMGQFFASQGAEPVGNTPEEFATIIRSDIARWSKVVKEAGISVN